MGTGGGTGNAGTAPYAWLTVRDPKGKTYFPRTKTDIDPGETAFTILVKSGLSLRTSGHPEYGMYVEAIEGLGEFDEGPESGWMYRVNGSYPSRSSALEAVESGDSVEWLYTRDLGQDIGGGSATGSTTAPNANAAAEKPETEAPSSTVVKDGEATTTVDKDAKSGAGEKLVVNVATGGEAVSKVTALLPKEVVKAESGGKSEIEIRSELANVLLPERAVADLSSLGADVTVSAAKNADDSYTFTVAAGGGAIDRIDGGIKAIIPAPEAGGGDVAILVRADGTEEISKKSCVKDGKLIVPLDGSATVKIVNKGKTFADVPAGAWYEKNVAFASARELFSGTGADAFSPDTPMTRGMLVTVLHRLENAPSANGEPFADVDGGAYYAEAVIWASANAIVTGTGESSFAPGNDITREQLATILYRYAETLGSDVSGSGSTAAFADSGEISAFASAPLAWAVGDGLIQGRGGDTLAPKATATRAEVAAILERFIENSL
jgi:hypothetical protein